MIFSAGLRRDWHDYVMRPFEVAALETRNK
jgi:hypothetical protein